MLYRLAPLSMTLQYFQGHMQPELIQHQDNYSIPVGLYSKLVCRNDVGNVT